MADPFGHGADEAAVQRPTYRAGRKETSVRVYTLNQESRYLIVKNVPALGCADELIKLFALYGPIEEYRMMDEEESAPFTDIYWIKFAHISNARFAKRKLDGYSFLASSLDVTYAPQDETSGDTASKLEERRRTVLNKIDPARREREHAAREAETARWRPASRIADPALLPFPAPMWQQEALPPVNPGGSTFRPPARLAGAMTPGTPLGPPPAGRPWAGASGSAELAPREGEIGPSVQPQYFQSAAMNATVASVRKRLSQVDQSGATGPDPNYPADPVTPSTPGNQAAGQIVSRYQNLGQGILGQHNHFRGGPPRGSGWHQNRSQHKSPAGSRKLEEQAGPRTGVKKAKFNSSRR